MCRVAAALGVFLALAAPAWAACRPYDALCAMDENQRAARRTRGGGAEPVLRRCAQRAGVSIAYRFDQASGAWWIQLDGPARARNAMVACTQRAGFPTARVLLNP